MIQLFINGQPVSVIEGTSVAAALAQAKSYSRLSVCGENALHFVEWECVRNAVSILMDSECLLVRRCASKT